MLFPSSSPDRDREGGEEGRGQWSGSGMGEKDFCLSVFVLVLHFHKDIVFSLPFAAVFDGQKNRGGRWCSTWRWREFLLWLPAIDRLANGNTGILALPLIGQ